jgi:hypothetical protein
MAFAGSMRMPIMACVDALSNGAAIWTRASAFAWASILVMLIDFAPFFDEMFNAWRVPFPTSEPGTLRVWFSMSVLSPAISTIQSSVIQVGLESTLSAVFAFGRNWNWRYFLESGWSVPLKAGIWVWGKQRFKGSYAGNFNFDEMAPPGS